MARITVATKIEQSVKKEVEKVAKLEKRSLSNMIEVLIDRGLEVTKKN